MKKRRITTIPPGVGETATTRGCRPPLLEIWLAKPFLSIAKEDFFYHHGCSCSFLSDIAWGLMFELLRRSIR
jgi:hypothetical protein